MPGIDYQPAHNPGGRFAHGNPIGVVLHKTEGGYDHVLQGFLNGRRNPHFLIGKEELQAVQLVDTDVRANHVGPGANALYIGIEFESIAARRGFEHRQDPNTIADELTPFQISMGRDIVDWICRTHGIPKVGPPSSTAWRVARGHWHGVLGHANVAQGGFFHTDHGDTLLCHDFMALGVFPS